MYCEAGCRVFLNDDHLLNEEASLGEILQNADRALRALERAFRSNPQSELIARRLARVLRAKDRLEDAITVLRKGLESHLGSQSLHYDLAQSLRQQSPDADTTQGEALIFHLRHSFAPGDKNYEAQFWYARQLCLAGKGGDAQNFFSKLKQLHLPYRQKHKSRGIVLDKDGNLMVFYGQIYERQASFGFIRADNNGLEIYCSINPESEIANVLTVGKRVSYTLAFNLFGPVAQDVNALLL